MINHIEAFNKAINSKIVLKENTNIISNHLEKFKNFRSLTNEKTQYDLLVLNYMKCENVVPTSGQIFQFYLNEKKIDNFLLSKINKTEIFEVLCSKNERIINLINILINKNTSVHIKKSNTTFESIEVLNNYKFNVEYCISLKEEIYNNPKFCIVDAYIDSVSQIQHILEQASQNKDVLVICAKGYSNDVLNTFSVNYNRNTLTVVPCLVKVECGAVNDMFDLALVTGCEVISSSKGQLLSSIDYSKLPYVEFVKLEVNKNILNIRNNCNKNLVEHHLKQIKSRIVDEHNEKELLARINNLGSNYCIVSLKNDKNFEYRKNEIINYYKMFDSYLKYGMIKTEYGIFPYQAYIVAKKVYEEYKKVVDERVYYKDE